MLSRSPSRLDGIKALLNLFLHGFGVAVSASGITPVSYHTLLVERSVASVRVTTNQQKRHHYKQMHEALGGMVTWLKRLLGKTGKA